MALFVVNEDETGFENAIDNAINIANEVAKKYKDFWLISSKIKLFEDIEILLSDLNDYRREDDEEKNNSDSIIDGIGDRDRRMNKLSDNAPSLDFNINESDRKLIIASTNIKKVKINFYRMNTEILFSNSPFFKDSNDNNNNNDNGNKSAFAYISPNISNNIEIKSDGEDSQNDLTEFLIPKDLKNENLFIEIISSTLNICSPFYDNELNILIKESYGQLKVLVESKKNKNKLIPLPKAYVKVYSQTNYGENEFYKDGYTDIRGKFDYASISTDQLNKTKKFAIFVDISYSIYLIHFPLILMHLLLFNFFDYKINFNLPVYFLNYLFLTILISFFVYKFIEIPLRKKIRKKFLKNEIW